MRTISKKIMPLLSPTTAAPFPIDSYLHGSAVAEDSSVFVRPAFRAPHNVRLRVNIFWSLSDTGIYSLNDGQTPAEVISPAAKKLRELDAATGFVFDRSSARNGYLNDYSAAYPPRTEAPLPPSSDGLN
jgi:hypothetical protein